MKRLTLLAIFCFVATTLLAQGPTPVPKTTIVPSTATSYPFMGGGHVFHPVDFKKAGYVEEEFLVSGNANVYDWAADGAVTVRTANAPYTTRILVIRPASASKFSGNLVLEPFFSARRFDWGMMWGYSYESLMEKGDAWVGVTPPADIPGLKKFNPMRYGTLAADNPDPKAPCPGAGQNGPAAVEDGLRWDILSQVGAALKTPGGPMGNLKVEAIVMTTQGGDLLTYMNAFQSRAKLANGKSVVDGYLARNPGNVGKINQCAQNVAANDPRQGFHKIGAPIISVMAQGEVPDSVRLRRPDSDDAADRYRGYEVAGIAHMDGAAYTQFPSIADQTAAVGSAQGSVDWPFNAPCDPAIALPKQPMLGYIYDSSFENLFQWIRKGTPAPRAQPITLKANGDKQEVVVDEHGNGMGGVRSPYVDVPTATWATTTPGPGTCRELGHSTAFPSAKLQSLYPSDKMYAGKVAAEVDKMVKDRWLTEADGKKIKEESKALPKGGASPSSNNN
jgi:hypothetical protein